MSLHLFVDSDISKVMRDIDRVDLRCRQLTQNPVKIKLEVEGLGALDAALRSLTLALGSVAGDLSRISRVMGDINPGAINAAGQAAQQTGGFLRGAAQSALGFIAASVGISSVTSLFQSLKSTIIDFGSLQQNVLIGFETNLHGNKEAAEDLLDKLKQFAIPTPFEMPDLAPLAQQVVSFNLVQKDAKNLAEQVVGVLNDAGDAAFGLGRGQEGVNRIILALGQMQTATRVMGGEMMQLQQVGVNAWDYLAEATGKSTGEVRDLVSKGLVPAKEGIEAIRAGIQRDFGGAMEKAAGTFEGAMSGIRDTARQKLSNLFAPAFESLTELAVKASAVLQSKEFDRWVDEFTGKIEDAFAFASAVYNAFVETVQNNTPIVMALLVLLGARFIWLANAMIGKAMYQAGFAIGRFIGSMPPQFLIALAVVTAFAVAYQNNFLGIKDITDSVVNFVVDGVKSLSWAIAKVVEETTKLLGKIPDWALGPIGAAIKNAIGDQTGLADGVMADFEALDARAATFKANLTKNLSVEGVIGNLKTTIGNGLKSLMPDINKALAEGAADPPLSSQVKIAMPHIDTGDAGDSKANKAAKRKRDADAKAQQRAALKQLRDQLGDSAKAWDEYAKAVQKSAEAQIDHIDKLKREFTDLFGTVQEKFVALGMIDNPLGPAIAQFERLLDLARRARGIAGSAQGLIDIANRESRDLNQARENATNTASATATSTSKGPMPMLVGGSSAGSSGVSGDAANIIDTLAAGIKTPKGMASCGNFAAQLLDSLGYKMPRDAKGRISSNLNVAKNLRDYASAHGREVPISQSQAGDVIIWHGKRYGALKFAGGGYHAGVASGNGRVWNSSGNGPGNQKEEKIYDMAHAKAYRLNGSGNGVPQAPAATGKTAADIKQEADKLGKLFDSDPNSMGGSKLQAILEGGFDGSLSKISAVPKAWGKAVKDIEGQSVRFSMQSKLSSQEFQDDLEFMSRITGRKVPEIVAWLRKFANAADFKLNAQKKKEEFEAMAKATLKASQDTRWALEMEKSAGIVAGEKRASLLEFEGDLIRKGTLDERERGDLLEVEIARRERINDLIAKGATAPQAKNIAQNEADAETTSRAIARANAKEAESLAAFQTPVAWADVKTTGLREVVDNVLPQLRDALDDSSISGEELSKVIAGVPASLLQLERNAKDAGQGLDALPIRYRRLIEMLDELRARQGTATAKDRLAPYLDDAKAVASDAASELMQWGERNQTPIDAIANKAKRAAENIEAMRASFAGDDAALLKIDELSATTAQYYASALQSARALQSSQSEDKVGAWFKDLTNDSRMNGMMSGAETSIERLRQSLKRDKWSDEEIERVIPAERIRLKTEWLRDRVGESANGIHDAMTQSIEGFKDKGLSTLRDFADGVMSQLNRLAAQIISNALWNKAQGLFTSLLGSFAGGGAALGKSVGGAAAATGGGVPSIAAGLASSRGGLQFGGSFKTGLDFVPYDGFLAELHKGEAVLTAEENSLRNDGGAARDAAFSRTSGGGMGGGGGVVINNYYNVGKVVAPDTKKFTDSLPGTKTSDMSEAQSSKQLAQIARKGSKHL